ncbi:SufS family cysteine desulfurase [Luteolibacter yonseiensis]|uniref:cysteine desulfurase n=1 Tax=Luteolibacter yonseiensis TaxID=1144680 RepID=A0A934R3Z4_9BACT|nr:cysteine desulfurase [Luteolibacter yonseiensis]MBK1814774.1 SufS family cysteine desulfurase [Luteolibacter yonseiensis]
MSENRLHPGLLEADPGTGDPFGNDLISRLANEIFASSNRVPSVPDAPVTPPATVAGVPAHVPSSPSGPTTGSREIDLSGGFPSSHSPDAPPPVHPTVVAAEPDRDVPGGSTPQGGHVPGSKDSHEFGEPYSYSKNFNNPASSRSAAGSHFELPGFELLESGSQFYFLEGIGSSGVPKDVAYPSTALEAPLAGFDVEGVRRDFPALHQRVNGHPLIWLDNAATTHKPQSVLDATSSYYGRDNSNIHRAAHTLAGRSTELFESGREKVRQFLGAGDAKEIVFVRGTTEAINLVAQSYGKQNIGEGDEIILSVLEHHANIVPWQLLAAQTGAKIRVIPANDRGELLLEEVPGLFNARTKIVSITQVSNALGTINPVEEIIAIAHSHGVPVLVDGAQSTPHIPINVQAMDADFFVFSGHKVFGPTGIGALYGKSHLLEAMPPWQGGGHMIRDVTFEKTVYNNAPEKFEAGTPDIAGVVGLGAAIDYLFSVGIPALAAYEHSLLEYATAALASVPGLRPIGTAHHKASVLGFVIPGIENALIAKHLDQQGIAVRAGHHCAMPALRHFGVETTVRPSLAFYNTFAEVDALVHGLHQIVKR